MKKVNFELSFTNKSDHYVIWANHEKIIFAGSKEEVEKEKDKQSKYIGSKYNSLQIIAPQEKISNNLVKHIWKDDNGGRDLLGELMEGEC